MNRSMVVLLVISLTALFLALPGAPACGATVVEKENFTIEYELTTQARVESRLYNQGYLHTRYLTYSIAGKVHNSLARTIATLVLDFNVQGKPQRVVIENLGPYENKTFAQNLWEVQADQYLTATHSPSGARLSSPFPSSTVPDPPPVVFNSFTYTNRQGESKTVRL